MNWRDVLKNKEWPTFLKEAIEHPKQISHRIEEKNPKWARDFLSFASEVLEPTTAGRGFRVKELTDERAWVSMPHRWNTRLSQGEFPIGHLVSLAEFTLQIFFERHVDADWVRFFTRGVQLDLEEPVRETVWARFGLLSAERERLFYQLRSTGQLESEFIVGLVNTSEKSMGQARITLSFATDERLLPGRV